MRTSERDSSNVVSRALQLHARLADTGAFGGRALAPWDTDMALRVPPPINPRSCSARVDPCRIAEESWVVLCNLLLRVHQTVRIEKVDIILGEDQTPIELATSRTAVSTYPTRYATAPFKVIDLEPEGGSYSFLIGLASPLTAHNEEWLNAALQTWAEAVREGAYALAPTNPISDSVDPHGDGVDSYETTVEWAVFKLRADPIGALDALLNIFFKFHDRNQPIRTLEIG